MGILPIGFFSPLPLAMMIPFMATQSLAMGEAFGKSFQYGKRKISSMTNEEFNKLTFHDLMVEQTANISAIVPELTKQMAQSKTMQTAIFQEMVNLIPTFFDSLFSALKPEHIENTTLTSASPPPPITEIRYYNDRDGIPEETPQMKQLRELLEKSLEQQGTKESLAEKLKDKPPPIIRLPPTPPDEDALARGKSLREDEEWRAWSSKLASLKQAYYQNIKSNKVVSAWSGNKASRRAGRLGQLKTEKMGIISQIRQMSRDYRHPNNNIRENALRLRQAMGKFV